MQINVRILESQSRFLIILACTGVLVGGSDAQKCSSGDDNCDRADRHTASTGAPVGTMNDVSPKTDSAEAPQDPLINTFEVKDLPRPDLQNNAYVVDVAGVLTELQEQTLSNLCAGVHKNTTFYPWILTLDRIPTPEGKTTYFPQQLRLFGTQVLRHWFDGNHQKQGRSLIFIVVTGTNKLEIYASKNAKKKLKDGRIRGILRHPNITGSMQEKNYEMALLGSVSRAAVAIKSSSGMLSGGFGMMPVFIGGAFFFMMMQGKGFGPFGGKKTGTDFGESPREF